VRVDETKRDIVVNRFDAVPHELEVVSAKAGTHNHRR
jgi:hypothetical protein